MDYTTYEEVKKFIEENRLEKQLNGERSHKGTHYIYITEDIEKQKFYLGKRMCKCQDLFKEQYFGSGIVVKRIIQKHIKNNEDVNNRLKKHVLQICDDKDTTTDSEIKWITFFNASASELFYNISLGGDGGDNVTMNPNREEIKRNNARANLGKTLSEETKKKIGLTSAGRKHSTESIEKMKGFKSEEHKEKIRQGALNRDPETYNFLSEQMKGNQHFLGLKHSEESLEKMRLSKLGVKYSEESIGKRTLSRTENRLLKKITHSISSIFLLENYK